jgi:hypothetical protein
MRRPVRMDIVAEIETLDLQQKLMQFNDLMQQTNRSPDPKPSFYTAMRLEL